MSDGEAERHEADINAAECLARSAMRALVEATTQADREAAEVWCRTAKDNLARTLKAYGEYRRRRDWKKGS